MRLGKLLSPFTLLFSLRTIFHILSRNPDPVLLHHHFPLPTLLSVPTRDEEEEDFYHLHLLGSAPSDSAVGHRRISCALTQANLSTTVPLLRPIPEYHPQTSSISLPLFFFWYPSDSLQRISCLYYIKRKISKLFLSASIL